MKKRLISLLLAFSMMLTFLPAGAVSAFAEENTIDPEKGELLQSGVTINDKFIEEQMVQRPIKCGIIMPVV